ncbi:MAG: tetratricopeptide repeat protein [Chitinophagaceae bacterium]|nr:tetratricopeptide repeat protein [Chitinophagaceae bacterium]MCW5925414.1 tetratricopeptide repeat protein [Chitinophagaceae bacterium]
MKFPHSIERFTISNHSHYSFPPAGYVAIEETSDGAGDNFGLYWEIGKENNSPIVCSSRHEESLLVPEFKDFQSFVDWFDETDGLESPPMNLNDNDYFISLTNKAKVLTKNGKHEEAILRLERAVSLFGEYTETWYWLSENYYKTGQKEQGDKALVNSILSNYYFGVPSKKSVDKFNEMIPSDELKNNSLVKRKEGFISGGDYSTPFTIDYDLLLATVEGFKAMNDNRTAMIMKQNYGLLMSLENNEIVQKYGFNVRDWFENFNKELFSIYPDRAH